MQAFFFGNVDLKLTADGRIQILEFGPGINSGFEGLRIATGQNITDVLQRKWSALALPALILNSPPGSGLADHEHINGILPTISPPSTPFLPENLSSYGAVYGGGETRPLPQEWVLPLEDPTLHLVFDDKSTTHAAFVATGLQAHRPSTLLFERRWSATLVADIRRRLPARRYVLKAPDMEGGAGVVVVEDGDLGDVLRCLLPDEPPRIGSASVMAAVQTASRAQALAGSQSARRAYFSEVLQRAMSWSSSAQNPFQFMVEAYVPSKPVAHEGQVYDATMRVAFLWIRDNRRVSCEPFACYWKLPPKPTGGAGTLRDQTVSSYSLTRQAAVSVTQEDEDCVYRQLRAVLPPLVDHVTGQDIWADISAQPPDRQTSRWLHFGNSLAHHSHPPLAQDCLDRARALAPEYYKVDHEQGMLEHIQGHYAEAIASFTRGLERYPGNQAAYYRLGRAWLALGNREKAEEYFMQAPIYAQRIAAQLRAFETHGQPPAPKRLEMR